MEKDITQMQMPDFGKYLAERLEGLLLARVSIFVAGNKYILDLEYYTVKDGEAHKINGLGNFKTGDNLFTLISTCIVIGKYDEEQDYHELIKEFSHEELIQIINRDAPKLL